MQVQPGLFFLGGQRIALVNNFNDIFSVGLLHRKCLCVLISVSIQNKQERETNTQ